MLSWRYISNSTYLVLGPHGLHPWWLGSFQLGLFAVQYLFLSLFFVDSSGRVHSCKKCLPLWLRQIGFTEGGRFSSFLLRLHLEKFLDSLDQSRLSDQLFCFLLAVFSPVGNFVAISTSFWTQWISLTGYFSSCKFLEWLASSSMNALKSFWSRFSSFCHFTIFLIRKSNFGCIIFDSMWGIATRSFTWGRFSYTADFSAYM